MAKRFAGSGHSKRDDEKVSFSNESASLQVNFLDDKMSSAHLCRLVFLSIKGINTKTYIIRSFCWMLRDHILSSINYYP